MSKGLLRACLFNLFLGIFVVQWVAADDLTGILIVEISGLKDATGDVYVAVYNSDDDWLSEDAVFASEKVAIADALDGELVRTELQLPLDDYALTVFYDADGDGELDTNFIGIPKEPFAMSNNAVAKFGPPKYDEAVFTLGAEPHIQHIIIQTLD
ncbi:MAG: DUF2141 domain-containing protein [Halieaceae bacterium]|nr:DUF2141 domain-containing protein [Halieaceae bacterium]